MNYPTTGTFAAAKWEATTTKVQETLDEVVIVLDSQCAHHLLRKSLDACRFNHLLRAADPYQADASVRKADQMLLDAFEDILGCGLPPAQRVQVALPLSTDGCGLRSPLFVRPAARMSALARFHSKGAEDINLPAAARSLLATNNLPVVQELQSLFRQMSL